MHNQSLIASGMRSRFLAVALMTFLPCLPTRALAETMALPDVIRQVLAQNPDLTIQQIDAAIAESEMQRVEGMLDPVVKASVGVSDDKTPVASSFQPSRTRMAQASGSISQPLANGDTLTGSLAYNRNQTTYNSPLGAQLASINPAYRSQFDLSYRHPLLRGADRPDYQQAMQAARSDADAAALQQQTISRSLALQAVNSYYVLVNDAVQVKLAEQAVGRAGRLVEYQKFREQFGLIEASDRIQTEALLSARKLDLANVQAQRDADIASINRILLRSPDAAFSPTTGDRPSMQDPGSYDALVDAARKHRPEFAILKAQLQAAEARLAQAKDIEQSQLDVVAQVGTRSLDANAGAAAARTLSTNHPYAALSLEFSDTLGKNSARAAIRISELSRQRIIEQQNQLLERVRNDIASSWTTLRSGVPAYRQARTVVASQQRKLDAELKRYREGRSDTATIIQFENDLSNAERQAELQATSLMLAEKQLAWAKGTLMQELGIHPDTQGSKP